MTAIDVSFFNTLDGGDVTVFNGDLVGDSRLSTATYLLLFGGNDDDPKQSDRSRSWWGNSFEPDSAKHYRSRTQFLLNNTPATSANLRIIQDAVIRDLGPLISAGYVSVEQIEVYIVRKNTLQIIIDGVLSAEYPWGTL